MFGYFFRVFCVCLSFIFFGVVVGLIFAGQPNAGRVKQLDEKIPVRTNGGYFFWGDVLFDGDWHIQKNVVIGSYRLLDGNAVQRAYGTFDECKLRLDEVRAEEKLEAMSGNVLIILHGFGSSGHRTRKLANWFKGQNAYDHVINFTYPSTSQSILEHARMLDGVIRNLPRGVVRIDFVAHSLGCIVIRRYMSGPLDDDWVLEDGQVGERNNFLPDKRIGRFVMLGPPNHGSELATKFIGTDRVRLAITGETGKELGAHWSETAKSLGVPKCEFAIIAGGRGNNRGFSMMIAGDDDGIVSTEGTKLNGAAEWILFYIDHDGLLRTETIFAYALVFLKTGSFKSITPHNKPENKPIQNTQSRQ
ncbi:MAG: alpha/beta hydrolase [Planctomycetaceae bacterium]|jgi:pimeloyl-ACP methyl ester carboxylesterase|nr:alpha/beta hydrolase [Planctomycetaceae bacterium]